MIRLLPTSCLLIAAALILGCSAEPSEPSEPPAAAGTPEAVFEAFAAAAAEDDMPTVIGLLTPESQAMMTVGMVLSAAFSTMEDEGKQASFDALMRKYVSDWDEESDPTGGDEGPEALIRSIDDFPAFVAELSEWMSRNGDGESGFQELGELGPVTVAGDSATAQIDTEMGPQPVEFRKIDGAWRIHLPGPEEGMAGGDPGAAEDDGSPGIGTLWIDDTPYRLRHATAYRTKFFDDPVTVVQLTQREISGRQLDKLKTMLAAGGDDEFFVMGPNVKLTLDESGELVSLFAWADNLSINGDQGTVLDVEIAGGRVSGTASMPVPGEIFDSTYRIEAEFDTALVSPD